MIVGVDYYDQGIVNSSSGWVGNGAVTLSDGNDTGVLTQAGVDYILKDTFEGNTTANTRVLSAYVSDVLELTPQLSVMASVRVDNFRNEAWGNDTESNTQTVVSPKFGVVYQAVKDKVSIFGNCMNGFSNVSQKIMRMNYDVHVGAIAGLPGKILAFFLSAIIASLPVTGFLIWWGRRKKAKKQAVAEAKEKMQLMEA